MSIDEIQQGSYVKIHCKGCGNYGSGIGERCDYRNGGIFQVKDIISIGFMNPELAYTLKGQDGDYCYARQCERVTEASILRPNKQWYRLVEIDESVSIAIRSLAHRTERPYTTVNDLLREHFGLDNKQTDTERKPRAIILED